MMKNVLILTSMLWVGATVSAQQMRFDDVVRNLRNPDPKVRMGALQMLRASKHLEAILPVASLVNDPVDEIQLAAIDTELSFYLVEDVSARKRIAFIVEVRNSGKAETAFASGPLAVWPRPVPPELLTNLLKAVDDENAKVRIEALYTAGAIARPPLAEEHARRVIQALDHYDPAIRQAAARVAGRLQVKSAAEALIKTVNDSQQPVRFAAMRALGDIREETAITALMQQAEYYRHGEGAWSAADALARIGHASSIPFFTARLQDRDQFVRRAAVEGLGRAGARRQIPALEQMAGTDNSEMVRAAAAFALQSLGGNYVARLVETLDSDRMAPQVASYFLEVGPAAAPELLPHLQDPDPGIRGNVALILGAIGSEKDIPALERLLQDRDRQVLQAADRAIQRIKLRGSAPV